MRGWCQTITNRQLAIKLFLSHCLFAHGTHLLSTNCLQDLWCMWSHFILTTALPRVDIIVYVYELRCVRLLAPSCTVARQASLSVGFSRQEHLSRLPFPTPGDPPDPGIEPVSLVSPHWQVDSLPLYHLENLWTLLPPLYRWKYRGPRLQSTQR